MRPLPSLLLLSGLAAAAAASCLTESNSAGLSSDRPLSRRVKTADITFHLADGDSVNAEDMQAFLRGSQRTGIRP